jgi:hypothetical protein
VADLVYRLIALGVVAGLVWYGLRAYHQRALARIETAELDLDGYVKVALGQITFAWLCPDCGTPLLTREALDAHQSSSSACAVIGAELAAEEERAEAEAEQARWSASAVGNQAREDSWPALGADEAPAELGSGS